MTARRSDRTLTQARPPFTGLPKVPEISDTEGLPLPLPGPRYGALTLTEVGSAETSKSYITNIPHPSSETTARHVDNIRHIRQQLQLERADTCTAHKGSNSKRSPNALVPTDARPALLDSKTPNTPSLPNMRTISETSPRMKGSMCGCSPDALAPMTGTMPAYPNSKKPNAQGAWSKVRSSVTCRVESTDFTIIAFSVTQV